MQGVQQYCWTVLPQGLKISPTLFGEMLSRVLTPMFVDDFIDMSTCLQAKYLKNTIGTLNSANCGWNGSQKKAQVCK